MNGGRRTLAEQTRAKLLELWTGEESFGRPLGCVATTFTFDAELFEEQCLGRFLAIQSNPNETAKAYLIEREEKLSQCFACVLVDRGHATADRSLRWHLLPVALPGGGILHAKLSLLVWENCIRVLIGSANLTEPGYRRNQEVVASIEYRDADNPSPELLIQCIAFLNRVRRFAPGFGASGPQAALAEFLDSVRRQARSLPAPVKSDAECVLLPLVPGGDSILEQLKSLWKGSAPTDAWVLSPFFDKEQAATETAARLAGILTPMGTRCVTFSAPGRRLSDGTIQLDMPESLRSSSHAAVKHRFSIVPERLQIEGKAEDRALHAKALWLQRDDRVVYVLGSSNFTAAGLGLHPRCNIELNVAYLIKDRTSQFGKLCFHSWPLDEELGDANGVQFLSDGQPDSADDAGTPVLPAAFGLALYCLGSTGGHLELSIGANAPAQFVVIARDGSTILDATSWGIAGKPGVSLIPWPTKKPPSLLDVRWQDATNDDCTAQWVVNVEDMSSLPPPEELGSLSLADLMEILTSARPLHEVVARILERREATSRRCDQAELDPHKRVDTSQFLLRRMRRLSQALEGLRERLQQPVGSKEALQWRLQGPIGPIALAQRLADEDPSGAAFMITEVAATLRGLTWRPLGSLNAKVIKQHVDQTIQTLHRLATGALAPISLAKYVSNTFAELLT